MSIKKIILAVSVIAALASSASAISVVDTFVGSGDFAGPNRDVIGDSSIFSVSKADLTLSNDQTFLTVTIFSDYFSNKGYIGTNPGSLFLRTSSPASALAGSDGSSWNYGVKANNVNTAVAGSISTYALTSQNSFLISDSFNTGLWSEWRTNQEVDVNSASANLVSNSGSWEILGGNTLSFYIPISSIGGAAILASNIDFSWAMTCANDIIRGSVDFKEVPEPATVLLLGLGGVAAIRRRARV